VRSWNLFFVLSFNLDVERAAIGMPVFFASQHASANASRRELCSQA
jgi:hypothetical protein